MRRALRILAWGMGTLSLLAVLLGSALFIAGNTGPGRALLERLTYRLTSGHVALSGLAGAFPSQLFVEQLQLSDARGVWLRAQRVTLRWSPLAGFARRLQIDSLHAASVDMQRLPESSSADQHGATPSIPRIDVAAVTVDVVTLGAELAGAPAALTVRGNAHLRSLEDMIIDAAAHRIGEDGDYELRLKFDTQRMDGSLTLHEPAGGPLENLLGLPGLGALQTTLNLSGPRAAEQVELSIDAGALRGRAQGRFDLTGRSAELDFAFDSPALTPRADIAWQRASVHGHWHGSFMAPKADAHVEFDQLRLPGEFRLNTLRAEFGSDAATATLHALIDGLKIPGPRAQLLQESALAIDASMRLDQAKRPLDVRATHRLFDLHATTEIAGAWDQQRAALELRLPNLAALGGAGFRGNALLKAEFRNDGPVTRVQLDASAALAPGTEIWSGAVGDRATLQLSGAISESALNIESMKFAGRALSLTANGELPLRNPKQMHARWSLDATDLAAWSAALAGTLKASGSLDGPADALAAQAQLTSTLAVHGASAGTISAALDMRGLPSAPSGTLLAQGSFDGAPLHVDLAMERAAGGTVRALVRRADWKSARLDGEIGFTPAGAQASGQLRLEIGQLADLQHLLGAKVGGSIAGSVQFRPGQGRTHAQLQIEARDLTAGPWAGNAQLSAEGGTDALAFKLELQMPDWRGAPASLSANGSLNVAASLLSVTHAAANYRGQDMHLLSPARIALANGIAVEALKLGAQKAVLELDGRISPALDLRASLHGVDFALVNVFVPGLLSAGTIEAHAELAGSPSAPTGEVHLSATGMRPADDVALGLPSVDIRASAQLDGDGANIDARLAAGPASGLSVTGHTPFADEGDYDLKIDGNLNVGMINPLLEAHGQHAAGELTVHATVAGQIAAPQIDGSVNLSKGSLRDYARGLSLTNISAAIVGSEGRLRIDSLTAAAAPGTVSMTGSVGVLQSGMPVDLHIKAENAQPLASNLVTANLNADLHVTGTLRKRLDVAGSVQMNRTLIGIPSSLPPNVGVLDVRRRGKPAAVVSDRPLVIGLDVAVTAQEILVQGRGLNAEVGGELHVGGTADTPFVSGGFDLQRGSFSLASSNLNFITPGSVSFNGAGLKNKIDPTLDFTAQSTTSDGTVATLHITGLADAPQFEFTSNPPYPQDEIMARLLYGVPGAQLSGLQLAQIGVTLASLSGVGGDSGLNPLVKLQRSLGLDRLNVGAATTNTATGTENNGASIEAGRYITKRVFVVARQTTTGNAQVEAHVDLTKHLKLQTRLGNGTATVVGTTPENDPGSSIGLSYQIEY